MKINWLLILLLGLLISFGSIELSEGQDSHEEVFLQFRYQGIVNNYLSTLYHNDQFYISIGDLFSALVIDHSIDTGRLRIDGQYPNRGSFSIRFTDQRVIVGTRTINITADEFLISDFGYYLKSDLFDEIFRMNLSIDFGNLALFLDTPDTMPVVAQRQRSLRRERLLRTQQEILRDYYPLRNDRDTSVLNLGFFDYELTTNIGEFGNGLSYNTRIGGEVLGGDLQGSILGSYTEQATVFRTTNLRWRYGVVNNPLVSIVQLGQSRSSGITPTSFTGIQLTNKPIEPRYLYGETALTGTSVPDAEVELFRNNTLIDYTLAGPDGFYRFNVPITYGSSQYRIRTFNPAGLLEERDLRYQIPATFLPAGEVNYTVDAGRLDNPLAGSLDRGYLGQGRVSVGLSNRFTAGAGVEYFDDFHDGLPTFSGLLSSRFLTNHLITFEAANDAFYRGSIQAIYANNASFTAEYTHFTTIDRLYNPGQLESVLRTNLFTPFQIRNFPLFLRWNFSVENRETIIAYRYRVDLNTRVGRANLRVGFTDGQTGRIDWRTTPSARLTASSTYTFRSVSNRRSFLNSLFVRGQVRYFPTLNRFENVEIQLSRRVGGFGRFQFSYGRNFTGNFNLIRFTFSLDFNSFRSNSNVRTNRSNVNISQTFRGSVGYDSSNRNIILTNRQQVGQSAVAVRLFVDNNNSGTYDEGDELIPDQAVRIERSNSRTQTKEGISYITQLQAYRRYNLIINKGSINNPLLIPSFDRLSFISDPNQFKTIDIPFYTSGIIEGMVYRVRNGETTGLGGMRLFLVQVDALEGVEPLREEIRTFSDGSFYAFEIPPSKYEIRVDESQLNFLNAQSEPEVLEFTVRPLSEGDFIEGLVINLVPKDPFEVIEEPVEEIEGVTDEDTEDVSEVIPETTETKQEEFVTIAEEDSVNESVGETDDEQIEGIADSSDTELVDTLDESMKDVEGQLEDSLQSEETLTEIDVDSLIAEDTSFIETEDSDESTKEPIAEAMTDDEPVEEPIAEALTDDDSTEKPSEEELIEQAFANRPSADEDGSEEEESLEIEGLDESLIRDPNQERTISDIEIFTQDASCRFSIQMAEYRSLEEAFSGANRFERETGLAFQIYSAGPQSPFTIRTPEEPYFGEVLTTFNELLARSPSQKPAIITQCKENEEASPLRYLIQLATFSSEENAESFRDELRDQYRITSRLDLSGGALIRVQAGPYANRRELLNAFRILAQDNVSPGMFILVDPSSYFNMSQEFRLQVGMFSNPRDAVRYAFEISEAFNIDTFLIIDGSAVKVMVNKNYEAWDDAFRDFTLISSYENANQPAIHLSEQE